MGVTRDDLFGGDAGAQPARPGTYGIAPPAYRLPETTRLGAVHLQVADLERSLAYYQGVLGLRAVETADARARLAAHGDDRVLVELRERPGARRADLRPHLGLYHFAIVLPDRASLGRFAGHLSERDVRAGAADHLVSEAFYLTDPDGLGIEVYADRPRETWRRQGRELMMATDPVDVRGLVREAGDAPWTGMPPLSAMGHVHLHVGDTEAAGRFYADAIGFDRTVWRYPGALFMGAGGYHHHLGTNTWAGPRASTPATGDARLLAWTLELPEASHVEALAAHLDARGQRVTRTAAGVDVEDPWGTTVAVRSGAPA